MVGSRIKSIRNIKRLTQRDFAESLGVGQGHLSEIERGLKDPSDTMLTALIYRYGIEEKWLKSGRGPMVRDVATPTYPPEVQQYVDKLVAILTGPDKEACGKIKGYLDGFDVPPLVKKNTTSSAMTSKTGT